MKKLLYILPLLLSGCILTGTTPYYLHWETPENMDKSQKIIIFRNCNENSYHILNEEQQKIFDKADTSWESVRNNKEEYNMYKKVSSLKRSNFFQCLYDSGLRFKAPLHWCLAQDGYHNTRTCIENMKYRY